MTLGDRAHAALRSLDAGCQPAEVRHDVEALIGDLTAVGIADVPIERGDCVMSLDNTEVSG